MISFQLFFKSRGILNEEGFILFVRKNAIIVLIPKFGLEGMVFFDSKDKAAPTLVFDEEVLTSHFLEMSRTGLIQPQMHIFQNENLTCVFRVPLWK